MRAARSSMKSLLGSLLVASASAGALVAGSIAGSGAAQAGAFGLREQSARAEGMAFAGAAAGSGGIASMFWNPAAVTMKPGWNSDFNATLVAPEARITPTTGTLPPLLGLGASGDIGQAAVLPATYTSYQLNDRLWIGIAGAAPFGLITKPNNTWAGQVYSRTSRIFTLNFNPVIGYKVTDWLALAAGPQIEYFKATLRSATGLSPLAPTASVRGSDWGVGYTVGALLTPIEGTQFGVGFRSSIHHDLEGPVTGVGRGLAKLNTPEKVSVGLVQAITPTFRLNFGFEFDNWERINAIRVQALPTGTVVQSLRLDFRDGFYYAVGGEYDVTNQFTVRAGFAYEQSPIDDFNRGTRLPDSDRYHVSVGATYQWNEKLSINAAYTHIFFDRAPIRIVPGQALYIPPLAFVANSDASANVGSVGFTYRWDDPKVAIPAPIVAKY